MSRGNVHRSRHREPAARWPTISADAWDQMSSSLKKHNAAPKAEPANPIFANRLLSEPASIMADKSDAQPKPSVVSEPKPAIAAEPTPASPADLTPKKSRRFNAHKTKNKIQKYLNARDWENALQLTQTLRKNSPPDYLTPICYEAKIRMGLGEFEAALKLLQLLAIRDPGNPEHHLRLGRTYARLGESAKAYCAFFEANALRPNDPYTLYRMGMLLLSKDLLEARSPGEGEMAETKRQAAREARALFDQAFELLPQAMSQFRCGALEVVQAYYWSDDFERANFYRQQASDLFALQGKSFFHKLVDL